MRFWSTSWISNGKSVISFLLFKVAWHLYADHTTTSTAIQKSSSLGCDLYIFKRKNSSMLAT